MLYVDEINDLERLTALRLVWGKLLAETPQATFLQSLDWLETFWKHYGDRGRFRVLVVYAGQSVVGILPLWISRERTRLGAMRMLTYPLLDWGTFYGPIGGQPTATLLAALGYLRRSKRDWDVLELRWTRDSIDRGRTPRAMSATGFSPLAAPAREVAMIDLAGSWDAYWAARTSRWRNNVRRSEKLLGRGGPIEYVRHRPRSAADGDGEPRWELFDQCLEIAAASWQGDSRTGNTLTHADVLPFLKDVHAIAARAGALDVNLLYVAGRPLAFNYAYHFGGYVFGLRTGYRPEPEHGGAGSVLQGRTIADSFARGDRFYDLGADYLGCKRYWLSRVELSRSYAWYSPRAPRAQLLRAKRMLGAWRCATPRSAAAASAADC